MANKDYTMNSVKSSVEKLSAKNYTNWKIIMTSLLKSNGLWPYCIADTEIKTEEEMQEQEEAKHLMYISMEPSQITATGECLTAYDLWTKIKENNEGAEVTLRSSALADFLGLKYHKGESLVNYCGRYELALGRLEATGQQPEDQVKLWVFRNTLPKDIKQVVNTWTMANKDGKIPDLISQLKLQFHMEKTDMSDESIALYSSDRRGCKRQTEAEAQ